MKNNPFENAVKQLKKSALFLDNLENLEENLSILSSPDRVIEVSIPVKMDNWKTEVFTWYRSQHNNARWPYKWGIRFHQNVSLDEVKALSIWMTIKCSVVDIPLWWWKWGIIVNPKWLSKRELEQLSRWYVQKLYKYIWVNDDIPAPDVNTNSQIMAWMVDEYSRLLWTYSPGVFTWKPLSIWWSKWRDIATAQWWIFVLSQILENLWQNINWKKIIIQWAWNAWLTIAKLLINLWAKLIWISDSNWWIYNDNWINVESISKIKKEKKSVTEYKEATELSNSEILEKDCDILIPAALENQITEENADKIRAKLIIELANWPVTPTADEILFNKWILVIPDILANAWWVMVSYFEQVQNNTNYYWDEEEVNNKLETKMKKAANEVFEKYKFFNTDLRTGAYILALERIMNSMNSIKRNY